MQHNFTKIQCGNKVVGVVKDGVIIKNVKASSGFLKIPPAIAFDISSLEDAVNAGAKRVEVTDIETGTIYKISINHIWQKGFRFNRGCGRPLWCFSLILPLPAHGRVDPGGDAPPPIVLG